MPSPQEPYPLNYSSPITRHTVDNFDMKYMHEISEQPLANNNKKKKKVKKYRIPSISHKRTPMYTSFVPAPSSPDERQKPLPSPPQQKGMLPVITPLSPFSICGDDFQLEDPIDDDLDLQQMLLTIIETISKSAGQSSAKYKHEELMIPKSEGFREIARMDKVKELEPVRMASPPHVIAHVEPRYRILRRVVDEDISVSHTSAPDLGKKNIKLILNGKNTVDERGLCGHGHRHRQSSGHGHSFTHQPEQRGPSEMYEIFDPIPRIPVAPVWHADTSRTQTVTGATHATATGVTMAATKGATTNTTADVTMTAPITVTASALMTRAPNPTGHTRHDFHHSNRSEEYTLDKMQSLSESVTSDPSLKSPSYYDELQCQESNASNVSKTCSAILQEDIRNEFNTIRSRGSHHRHYHPHHQQQQTNEDPPRNLQKSHSQGSGLTEPRSSVRRSQWMQSLNQPMWDWGMIEHNIDKIQKSLDRQQRDSKNRSNKTNTLRPDDGLMWRREHDMPLEAG